MEKEDLKWYSPFVFLVEAMLSFADPITDILTFVLLSCLAFPAMFYMLRTRRSHLSPSNWARTALIACSTRVTRER